MTNNEDIVIEFRDARLAEMKASIAYRKARKEAVELMNKLDVDRLSVDGIILERKTMHFAEKMQKEKDIRFVKVITGGEEFDKTRRELTKASNELTKSNDNYKPPAPPSTDTQPPLAHS